MERYYYSSRVSDFINEDRDSICGKLARNDQSEAKKLQKNAWESEIDILKRELAPFEDGHVLFEYTIPRIGSRIDNVLTYKGIIFLLEFKVGANEYPRHGIDQAMDYALDLSCFHKQSHNRLLVPMLICTEANEKFKEISEVKSNILDVILCNQHNIGKYISLVCEKYNRYSFDPQIWIDSEYMPTPTIIEAARVLYSKHNVKDISRNDASAINLSKTMKSVSDIIEYSKKNNKKSICFITGVPGAGKTLAGLNIAVERQGVDENEHAIFLSGNGPLVYVLQEALTRDGALANKISKVDARRKIKDFIQIIHHFRDDAISTEEPPVERVVIFDEAQRAWDEPNLSNFMKVKKRRGKF